MPRFDCFEFGGRPRRKQIDASLAFYDFRIVSSFSLMLPRGFALSTQLAPEYNGEKQYKGRLVARKNVIDFLLNMLNDKSVHLFSSYIQVLQLLNGLVIQDEMKLMVVQNGIEVISLFGLY